MSERDVDYAGMLDMTDADIEDVQRKASVWLACMTLLAWILFLGSVGYALVDLWKTGQGGSWHDYWEAVKGVWTFLGAVLGVSALKGLITSALVQIRALRALAAEGDEEWAPPARPQPEPLSPADLLDLTGRVGPLDRPEARRTRRLRVLAGLFILLLGVGAGAGLAFGGPSLLRWYPDSSSILLIVVLAICTVGGIVGGVWALLVVRRFRQPLYVVADEWGLRWRRPHRGGDWASIAWHDARAFYILVPPRAGSDAAVVIEGGDAILAWQLSGRASSATRETGDLLMRLITTRTRLPLRDVSQAFAKLPHLPSPDVASPSDNSLEMPVRPSEEWKRRIHPSWYPIFAALFLVAMLYVLGWVGQFIQVHR